MIYGVDKDKHGNWHVTIKRGDEVNYLCQAIDERCARETARQLNELRS